MENARIGVPWVTSGVFTGAFEVSGSQKNVSVSGSSSTIAGHQSGPKLVTQTDEIYPSLKFFSTQDERILTLSICIYHKRHWIGLERSPSASFCGLIVWVVYENTCLILKCTCWRRSSHPFRPRAILGAGRRRTQLCHLLNEIIINKWKNSFKVFVVQIKWIGRYPLNSPLFLTDLPLKSINVTALNALHATANLAFEFGKFVFTFIWSFSIFVYFRVENGWLSMYSI